MKPSHPISRSTSAVVRPRLHLNAFRGVRAISKFDWPFTPTLTSSRSFSTLIGSVLHLVLPRLQPAHDKITLASGLLHATHLALFRLGFPSAPELLFLNLAAYRNSQVYSTKDTPLPLQAVTSCQSMVSGSISLPLPGFFSPFPHGTCSLSVAV